MWHVFTINFNKNSRFWSKYQSEKKDKKIKIKQKRALTHKQFIISAKIMKRWKICNKMGQKHLYKTRKNY